MLRQELAQQFQRQLPEYLDGMVTITAVRVSADLSIAKVYVSIFNSKTAPDILIKRLNSNQTELRTQVAHAIRLRKMPALRFYRDDTLDTAERIEKLLQEVKEDDEERRRQREASSDSDDHAGEQPSEGQ